MLGFEWTWDNLYLSIYVSMYLSIYLSIYLFTMIRDRQKWKSMTVVSYDSTNFCGNNLYKKHLVLLIMVASLGKLKPGIIKNLHEQQAEHALVTQLAEKFDLSSVDYIFMRSFVSIVLPGMNFFFTSDSLFLEICIDYILCIGA